MTHIRNMQNIMKHGILSYSDARNKHAVMVDIADPNVQDRREKKREPVFGRLIHEYVPLYLNPRNPMLYRRNDWQADIAILCVSFDIGEVYQCVFTDGNAASGRTRFSATCDIIKDCIEVLLGKYWNNYEDGKRRMCAEVLVYPKIESCILSV